jgi:hypothetical protein
VNSPPYREVGPTRATVRDPPASAVRAWQQGGQLFRAVGFLWLAAGSYFAIFACLATPNNNAAHGMVPGVVGQTAILFIAAAATGPSVLLVVLGALLAKGTRIAPLGIIAGGFLVVPLALNIGLSAPESMEYPGALVAKVVGLLLMLPPTALVLKGSAEAHDSFASPVLEWLRQRPLSVAIAVPIALASVALSVRLVGLTMTPEEERPAASRSNASLIRQVTNNPQVDSSDRRYLARKASYERALFELHRRGDSATHDAEATLNGLPPGKEDPRMEPLMGLLADLHSPDGVDTLRSWLRRRDAAPRVRALAAVALARVHDIESSSAVLQLLDPPDPDPMHPEEDMGRPKVIWALQVMPVSSINAIRAMLLRQGPGVPGSKEGLDALHYSSEIGHSSEAYHALQDVKRAWGTAFPSDLLP